MKWAKSTFHFLRKSDIFKFSFDLVGQQWTQIKPAGTGPTARSGVQMGATEKEKIKSSKNRGNLNLFTIRL